MRWRVLAVMVSVGTLATFLGWAAGSARAACEHSCPANGACPEPADCRLHTFNWTAAIAVGVIVAVFAVIAAWVPSRRPVMRPGQPGPDCRY